MVKEKLTEGTEVSSNSMKALNSNPANTIAVNAVSYTHLRAHET